MLTKARREDVDCAKGLAILLVVFGHIVSASAVPPSGNGWYLFLRQVIYEFHMPFFMYLSGYVTFLSGAAGTGIGGWPTLVRKRAGRLLLPFLVFGLLIVVGKWIASHVLDVDNMPSSVSQALLGLIWNTDKSPATSVWYIAVLFVYCIVTPPLLWLSSNRTVVPLALAAVLYFLPMPHILYLDRLAIYYIFFMIGGVCSRQDDLWLPFIDKHAIGLFVLFIVLIVFFTMRQSTKLDWSVKLLLAGVLSIPALHGLVRRKPLEASKTLLFVGVYSFVIYLLNTPFLGLLKGVFLKLAPWDGPNFLIYAPLLMCGGTLGPILFKKIALRPFPALDRVTD